MNTYDWFPVTRMIALRNKTMAHTILPSIDDANGFLRQERQISDILLPWLEEVTHFLSIEIRKAKSLTLRNFAAIDFCFKTNRSCNSYFSPTIHHLDFYILPNKWF